MKKSSLFDKIRERFSKKSEEVKHMKISSVLLIGYRNIAINRTRSFLTIGGVSIGIGIITFLISLGFGVQAMVIKEVTKNNPTDIIDVSNENLENFVVLDDETIDKIKNISGVKSVEVSANVGGKFINGDAQTDAILYGVSPGYLTLSNTDIENISIGDFSSSEGIVVTPRLAALLGFEKTQDAVGNEVEYYAVVTKDIVDTDTIEKEGEQQPGKKVKILGIVNDQSKADAVYAYMMFETLKSEYKIAAGQRGKISISNMEKIDLIRSQIEQLGFVTESVIDTVNDINSFFSIVRVVLIIFGTIIMSISAMGMMNTLSVSLLQRTKEVGILKALGAKRTDIFKMFIFEAILISFSGGAIGLLGGYGMAKGLNFVVNIISSRYGISPADFVLVPNIFIIAIVTFIVILGISTGVFPARRASKIHALEALRYE
ncbi:MAG: ABC transporter permease [Candidatus Moranbacteria bacterium]|nr:ABC transporter permease [Candidatus Moranbacteria bacterium]